MLPGTLEPPEGVRRKVWLEQGLEGLHLDLWGPLKVSEQANNAGHAWENHLVTMRGIMSPHLVLEPPHLALPPMKMRASAVHMGDSGAQGLLLLMGMTHMQNGSSLKYIRKKFF